MTQFQFEAWPTEFKVITQHFGVNPGDYAEFGLPGHEGIDLRADIGSKILCVAPGRVSQVHPDNDVHNYGTFVRVQHEDGYESTYAHLQEIRVQPNQTVQAGQILGVAGKSGNVTGPHLHLTLKRKNGTPTIYPHNIIDPTPFLMPLKEEAWGDATYVRDTIPDGTVFEPGQRFTQTWTLRNSGDLRWEGCSLRRLRGDAMGAPERIALPNIPPNAEAPVMVEFMAPREAGSYIGVYQPSDAEGVLFGDPIWIAIEVPARAMEQPEIRPSDGFVRCVNTEFVVDDERFRFIGVNQRGLVHYGHRQSDPLQHSRHHHVSSQLRAAYEMGARVVRLFLPDKDATVAKIAERLRTVIEIIKVDFPDLYLLPALTNLYNDVPFYVPGDDGYFANAGGRDLLNESFFKETYAENYLPFVEQIVTEFRNEPNIFAWEIGNELKLDRGNPHDAEDPLPWLFIKFNRKVAARIKSLDPNHLVTTGMKSTHHAWLHTPALQEALYDSPNIDFITIHSYEGMWDQEGDARVYDDAALATRLNKPFIVEEAGFDVNLFADRAAKHREHLDKWLMLGARGYMPWGFIHAHEIGDGDNDVGFGVNHGDFDNLRQLFQEYAGSINLVSRGFVPHAAPLPASRGATARSVVGFAFLDYQRRFLENPTPDDPVNDALDKGVSVRRAAVTPGQFYWKAIGIHHLEPAENTGKHAIFVDALDEHGGQTRHGPLQVEWGWEGQQPDQESRPQKFEKPTSEPGTNLQLTKASHWIRIGGDGLPSDVVQGMHTDHDDEPGPNGETWNSRGHHSFYVVFQKTQAAAESVDDDQIETPAEEEGEESQTQIFIPIVWNQNARMKKIPTREKLGIDANAPIHASSGKIGMQVSDPGIIADTGVGWVRINFILGERWSHPTDQHRVDNRTWEESYRAIINGFTNRNLKIYGLISNEAVRRHPDGRFRQPPTGDPLADDWIQEYVATFVTIARLFRDELEVIESFNEPDDWKQGRFGWNDRDRNWIHPHWFAAMLEAIYRAMRAPTNADLHHIRLVSGPLQGLAVNGNAGSRYLKEVYSYGRQVLGWGVRRPVPFDGIGYHLYIAENPREPASEIPTMYNDFMNELRDVISLHEGGVKPIYLSEYGWDTRHMSEEKQAVCMRIGLQTLLDDPSVALGVWFCTQDFEKQYGIFHQHSLERKQSYGAFHAICHQLTTVTAATQNSVATLDRQDIGDSIQLTDNATYVRETDQVFDGTVMPAGTRFTKRWVLKNSGTSTWTGDYKLAQVPGESAGITGPHSVAIATGVPGAEVAIAVELTAPLMAGTHVSTWRMMSPDGEFFGQRVWTQIVVDAETAPRAMRTGSGSATMERAAESAVASPRLMHGEATARSPQPLKPEQMGGKTLKEYDPELYVAWSEHIKQGFENNTIMFNRILEGFMQPYRTSIWLYRILFGVGILAFVVSVAMAIWSDRSLAQVGGAALFGGLGLAAVLSFFVSRPLQALEENLQFITWLGIVYNTYWSRVTYAMDHDTFHKQIEDANNDAINSIKEMLDKHAAQSKSRPGLR